jgi:flagellar biosynthesis anti-sigma factor FlgM
LAARYSSVADFDGDMPMIPLMAAPGNRTSSGSCPPDEQALAAKIQSLLDRIRALDKSMDEARMEKIAKIKKALADGTYHVRAAKVARKIIDHMQDP